MERKKIEIIKQFILNIAVLVALFFAFILVNAAFTEPVAAPAASNQDFAQNILGANNANNSFDSSAVVGNKNGSIIEMMEYINNRMTTQGQWYSGECADSTTGTKTNCYVDDTAKYVDSNACSAASNDGYCFVATSTLSLLDLDLIAANIKKDINIFGIVGTAPTQIECCATHVWPQYFGCMTSYCTLGSYCTAEYSYEDVDYSVWSFKVETNTTYNGGSNVWCTTFRDGAAYGSAGGGNCLCRLK